MNAPAINSASLVMPLDAVRFVLAYLLLILIPGYAVATLGRPGASRIERTVLSIPCACTLVTLCGLATTLMHLPFEILTYAAIAIPAVLAGAYAVRSTPTFNSSGACREGRTRWFIAPIIVGAAQVATTLFVYQYSAVPSGEDIVTHIGYITGIVQSHAFPLVLLNSNNSSISQGGFYPPAFHALTALVIDLAPMPTYRAGFFSILACSSVLPLGLYAYVRTVTGNARIAGLATIGTLAFESLPFKVIAGGLYPFVAAQTFVPAFALTVAAAVARHDRRAIALAAFLGIGLFYTHPTELLTAVLLALAAAAPLLRTRAAWRRAVACGMICGVVGVIAACPVVRAVHRTMAVGAGEEIQARHLFVPASHPQVLATALDYVYWLCTRNSSYVLCGLALLGGVWCLTQRRYCTILVMQAALFMLYVDVHTYAILQRLYIVSFPWILDERLIPTHYWFMLPLAGVGADAVMRRAQSLFHTHSNSSRACAYLLAMLVVFVGLIWPLGKGTLIDLHDYIAVTITRPSDVAALEWLVHHAPANAVVVNEALLGDPLVDPPMDAGIWIPSLVSAQPLFNRWGFGPGKPNERLFVLSHLTDVPLPMRVARYVAAHRVRYVFYGSRVIGGYRRRLRLSALLASPSMSLAFSSVSTCRVDQRNSMSDCPVSGSYVFAVHAPHAVGHLEAGA